MNQQTQKTDSTNHKKKRKTRNAAKKCDEFRECRVHIHSQSTYY